MAGRIDPNEVLDFIRFQRPYLSHLTPYVKRDAVAADKAGTTSDLTCPNCDASSLHDTPAALVCPLCDYQEPPR